MSEMEEAVAKAIARVDGWELSEPLEPCDPKSKNGRSLARARAALAVVRERMGEPRPEMLDAANKAWSRFPKGCAPQFDFIYRALIATSPLGDRT